MKTDTWHFVERCEKFFVRGWMKFVSAHCSASDMPARFLQNCVLSDYDTASNNTRTRGEDDGCKFALLDASPPILLILELE